MEGKWHERYPEKLRCRAVVRMNACDNIVRLARELGLNRSLLYKWRHRLDPVDGRAQSEIALHNSRESTLRREIDKLKRLLANKTVEVDFFRIALQKAEARRRNSGISGEQASTLQSKTSLQGSLSVERMCQLGQVSRAGFYRYLQAQAPMEESMTVRSAIQDIALEHRKRYAYRRITAELRRRGLTVNHKRVARMMQADNLLAIRNCEWFGATHSNAELAKIDSAGRCWPLISSGPARCSCSLQGRIVPLSVTIASSARKTTCKALTTGHLDKFPSDVGLHPILEREKRSGPIPRRRPKWDS